MPFDSAGIFTRLRSWASDAAAGIRIRSDYHDQNDNDIAAGLSNVITKDGRTQPTANLPMNLKRFVNMGDPVDPADAATKSYVDNFKNFATGAVITGADANGRISFAATTGANGFSWAGADLSWLARLATTTPATLNRLVLNDKPDGSGTDVVTVNDDGSIAAKSLTTTGNVLAAGTVAGTPMVISKATAGNVHFWLRGPNDEDRMVLYTTAATAGDTVLRVIGTQSFTFNTSGQFKAPGAVFAGAAFLNTDGNISGSVWDNFGAHDAYTAINARIESRAQAWANDRVSNLQYRKVSEGDSGNQTDWRAPAGAVVNGFTKARLDWPIASMKYIYLQVYDPVRGWVGFSG